MAFKYIVTERKMIAKGGQHSRQQVARQVNLGRVDIDQLATEIAEVTSLGEGDVKSVLLHLAKQSVSYLTMGFSVQLGDLGTLTPRISAKAIPVGGKYTTDLIRRVNVRYTPSSAMKTRLKGIGYERWEPRDEQSGTCPAPSPEPSKPKENKEQDHSGL